VRWQAQDRDLEDLFMDFYRDAPDRDAPEAVAPAAPDVASPAPDVPAPTGGTQR
jgi:hypothetical protein